MKTYWTPQNTACRDCQWPLFNGEEYCTDCQGVNERIQSIKVNACEQEREVPLQRKLTVDMSESEYTRYKRIYGSCLDEERNGGGNDYELL